ncbi:antibiotic biosynthesis monooxygenase [Bacillus sp. SL00103]
MYFQEEDEHLRTSAGLSLRVLRPKKDEEVYLIMTLWESEDLFEDFQESEAFFQPNDDTGSIFSRPAYLTSYHAVTDN